MKININIETKCRGCYLFKRLLIDEDKKEIYYLRSIHPGVDTRITSDHYSLFKYDFNLKKFIKIENNNIIKNVVEAFDDSKDKGFYSNKDLKLLYDNSKFTINGKLYTTEDFE